MSISRFTAQTALMLSSGKNNYINTFLIKFDKNQEKFYQKCINSIKERAKEGNYRTIVHSLNEFENFPFTLCFRGVKNQLEQDGFQVQVFEWKYDFTKGKIIIDW